MAGILRLRHSRRTILVTVPVLVLLVIIGSLIWTQSVSSSLPKTAPNPIVVKPTVRVLGKQNASALGLPLIAIGKDFKGNAPSRQTSSAGIPVEVYDSGHMELALYRGTFSNGTLVYIVAFSNIGQQNVTVDQLGIAAQNSTAPLGGVLQAFIVGCAHNPTFIETEGTVYPNGTTTETSLTATINCGTPALLDPFTLGPGESFSAYIAGNNFLAGNLPLTDFASGASYSVAGIPYEWDISVGNLP